MLVVWQGDSVDREGIDYVSYLFGKISDRFAAKSNGSNLLKENMAKTVLYSSAIEGNRLDDSAASMLINGDLEVGDGRLVDYIELLNHKEMYKRITEIGDREITPQDIIGIHETLFSNLLNNLYVGPRRSMTSVADFITEGSEKILYELAELSGVLNRQASNAAEAFSNALDFHIEFIYRHPFEDGNGRTVRVLMNWYLLKNGLAPVLVTKAEKEYYFNSLAPTHFCKYYDAFASFMLYAMIRGAGMDVGEFAAGIGETDEGRLIKDYLMIFDSNMNQDALAGEISALYSSGNKRTKLGVVWMAGYLETHADILVDAIHSENPDLVSMAMLSMQKRATDGRKGGVAELERQAERIRAIALEGSELERLLAISTLGKMWMLNKDIVSRILSNSKDARVVAQTFNALRYASHNSDSLTIMDSYTKNKELDISLNALLAFIANAPTSDVENHLRAIDRERDEIKDEVIKWLVRFRREENGKQLDMINLDGIAETLVETAARDFRVRKLLLGHLSIAEGLNPIYVNMLTGIANDANADKTERAYAAYSLGRNMGYGYLHSRTSLEVNGSNDLLMNMAVFLSMTGEKGRENEMLKALDVEDNSLNMIEAASMGKMLGAGTFGTDFLLLCRRSFRAWKDALQIS